MKKRMSKTIRASSNLVDASMNSTMGGELFSMSGRAFSQPSPLFTSTSEFNKTPSVFYFSSGKTTDIKDLNLPKNCFYDLLPFTPDLRLIPQPEKDAAFNEVVPAGMVESAGHKIKTFTYEDKRIVGSRPGRYHENMSQSGGTMRSGAMSSPSCSPELSPFAEHSDASFHFKGKK
jgi:hypothetical protein